MTFADTLAAWVERRQKYEPGTVSDVAIESMDEARSCGNDTCWFDAEIELSYGYRDEAQRRTLLTCDSPGEFVQQLAELAKAAA